MTQSNDNREWLLDRGATHHLNTDSTNIDKAKNYHSIACVTVGNGNKLSIQHLDNSDKLFTIIELH